MLLGIGLSVLLLATLAVVGLRVLTDRYEATMTRAELLDPSARADRTDLDGPLNYLLVVRTGVQVTPTPNSAPTPS